jgi:hypothetical protein
VITANRFKVKPRHYEHKHQWKDAITRAKGVHMFYVGKDAAVTRRINRRPTENVATSGASDSPRNRRSLVDLEGEAAGWGVTRRGDDENDDTDDEAYYSDSDEDAGGGRSRRESVKSNKSRNPSLTPSSKRNSQTTAGTSEKRSSFISAITNAIMGVSSASKRMSMSNGSLDGMASPTGGGGNMDGIVTPSSKRSTMNNGSMEAPAPLEKRTSFLGSVASMAFSSGKDASGNTNVSTSPEKRNSLLSAAMGLSGKSNSTVTNQDSSGMDQSKRSSFVGAVTKMFGGGGGGSTDPVAKPVINTKQVEVKPQPLKGKKVEENTVKKPVQNVKRYDFEDVSSDDSDDAYPAPKAAINPRANMRKVVSRITPSAPSPTPSTNTQSNVQSNASRYNSNARRDMFE